MEVANFYELDAWKRSHDLTLVIYQLTQALPKSEKFGLASQLQRASSSVSANIAEGFERHYFKDKIRFYYQARGSVAEVQSFLFLARDLGYLVEVEFARLMEMTQDVRKLINGLVRAVRKNI